MNAIAKWTGIALVLCAAWPGILQARDNNASYPDFPFHGIKIDCTASGNFELTRKEEQTYQTLGSVLKTRRYIMCPEGPIDTLGIHGNVHVTLENDTGDFDSVAMYATLYESTDPTEPKEIAEYTKSASAAQPSFDWPFALSKPVTPGNRIDFQVQVYVCRFLDEGHDELACFHAVTGGDNVESILTPNDCFDVKEFTPKDGSPNVDFDEPDITMTFTRPADPATVNDKTFRVYYWNESKVKTYIDGYIDMDDTDTVATFTPLRPLMDGVFYGVELWGKNDAKAFNRTDWVKSANFANLLDGKRWAFWTLPDLEKKVTIVPVQSLEDVDFIKDKPAVIKVFMRWDKKKNVHPMRQRNDLEANVTVHTVLQPTSGPPILAAASWQKGGKTTARWTPVFGTKIKRDYTPDPKDTSTYTKYEKKKARDSVNYYGFRPSAEGSVYIQAEVEPIGQDTSKRKARTFLSDLVEKRVRDTLGLRVRFVPVDWGGWTGLPGFVVPCPAPSTARCVNVDGFMSLNARYLRDSYPYASGEVAWNVTSNIALTATPATMSLTVAKATGGDWSTLLAWLDQFALRAQSSLGAGSPYRYVLYAGVFPRDWLGLPGVTYPGAWYWPGYRNAILLGHNISYPVLGHETGHVLPETDFGHTDGDLTPEEAFWVPRREDYRTSVRNLPGAPTLVPIFNLMDTDVSKTDRDYWPSRAEFRQAMQQTVRRLSDQKPLGGGDRLLLASGHVALPAHSVTLEPWYVLDTGSWTKPGSGDYAVDFIGTGGAVLASHPFDVTPPEDNTSHFGLALPYPAGTQSVRITYQGSSIKVIVPTAHAPLLTITAPAGGAMWTGVKSATWSSSDADPGDKVFHTVTLSTDGGKTWDTLAVNLTGGPFEIDTRGVEDSTDCYLTVDATDGLNTTSRTVGPFTIANPPRVVTTDPSTGATGVPIASPIVAGFSEAVDADTLGSTSFFLTDALGHAVTGSIEYRADTAEGVFLPASPLGFAATYTATVTTSVHAADGTPLEAAAVWSFQTEGAAGAPHVIETYPKSGETGVPRNATLVSARFDREMNPSTLTDATFTLEDDTGTTLEASVSYDAATRTVVLRPQQNLAAQATYRAMLKAGVKDAFGNALAEAYSWSFESGVENALWVRFTGNFKDYTADLDGDGEWDALFIDVEFSCLFTSRYRLTGWLMDKDGLPIGSAGMDATPLVPGSHVVSLSFPRTAIEAHGKEGPFVFSDGFIYDVDYPSSMDAQIDPYVTRFEDYLADLTLAGAAYPPTARQGENFSLMLLVENEGTSGVASVVVTDTLPAEVTYVSAETGQGSCSYNAGARRVTCPIGTLAGGGGTVVTITVTPNTPGWITNSAAVAGAADADLGNNTAETDILVVTAKGLFMPYVVSEN